MRFACLSSACVLMLVSGCTRPQAAARADAQKRWNVVRADLKARLAAEQFAAGHLDQAAGELDEAVRLDPNNADLLPLRARLLLSKGELSAAQRVLDGSRTTGPNQAELSYLRGVLAQQRLDWSGAIRCFREAVKLDAGDVEYLVALAQALLQSGQPDEALAALRRGEPHLGWMGAYQATLAECHEALKNWPEAVQAWMQVADQANQDPFVRERLALALWQSGQNQRAAEALEAVVSEQPDRPSLRIALAGCLIDLRRPDDAARHLSSLLQQDPNNGLALAAMARVHALRGDAAAGLRTVRMALRERPDDVGLNELALVLACQAGNTGEARQFAGQLKASGESDALLRDLADCVEAAR